MNQRDVMPEHATMIGKALFPNLNYLLRLKTHMEKAGFPPNDPLFALVNQAYDAVHHLSVDVHYRACGVEIGPNSRQSCR